MSDKASTRASADNSGPGRAGMTGGPIDLAALAEAPAAFDWAGFTFRDGYAVAAPAGTDAERAAISQVLLALARGRRDPATMRSEAMRACVHAEGCGPRARRAVLDVLRKVAATPAEPMAVSLWRQRARG